MIGIKPDTLKIWKTKIKKEITSKTFWIAVAFASLTAVGSTMGQSNPQFLYLEIPFAVIVMATLPGVAGLVMSVRISSIMLWLDKNTSRIWSKPRIQYFQNKQFQEKESYRNFALYNLWYTVGVTFLILRTLGISKTNEQNILSLIVAITFLTLIFGSGINLAIFLTKKMSIFRENREDGSIINLGNSYRGKINSVLALPQIVLFIYALRKESDFYPLLVTLGTSMLICFVSSLTSYYTLKKYYIQKLVDRFVRKNGKYFLPDFKGCP